MKKFYLIAAMAVATLTASAQQKLYLSTYNGTNLENCDGKVYNVTVNRYVFQGWNTIALPFAVSEQELNETFGNDCKLEKLIGANQTNGGVQLYFQDCKAGGIEPNVPYILYFTGETANKKLVKEARINNSDAALNYTLPNGETVTMAAVLQKTQGTGCYGVLARDNAEAKFAKVDESLNGFLATRCYIQLSSGNDTQLFTRHLAQGETMGIENVANDSKLVDVYNTAGVKVASQVRANQVSTLQPGIYVINGQKILVK